MERRGQQVPCRNVIGVTFNSVLREMKLAVKAVGKLYLEDLRMREDHVCLWKYYSVQTLLESSVFD